MPPLPAKNACLIVLVFLDATLACWGWWKSLEALNFDFYFPLLFAFCLGPFCLMTLCVTRDGSEDAPLFAGGMMAFVQFAMGLALLTGNVVFDYQELAVTRQGLEASAAPGWASVTCTEDADPQGIDVATDRYTYFTLAASDWRVASENASVVASEKRRRRRLMWSVAPIEYVGPVDGCRTKYPLFAVYVGFNNAFGRGGSHNGTLTYMRLLSADSEIDDDDKDVFWDEWVPNPYDPSQKVKLHHENLFKYDSVSYDDAARLVAEKEEAYDEVMTRFVVAWFGLTVPLMLCACCSLCWTRRNARVPINACDESNGAVDSVPLEPTSPVATPEEDRPSPPLATPEAPQPSPAPPSEHTAVPWRGGGDGRAGTGLGDRPLRFWEVTDEHEADVTNPLRSAPLSTAPHATVDWQSC